MFPIPHEAGYIAVPWVLTPSWTGPSLIPDGCLAGRKTFSGQEKQE